MMGLPEVIFVPGKETKAGFIWTIRTVGADAVQGRKWPRPSGLGRHGPSCAVAAPIRSYGYGYSLRPRITTRGAPNKPIISHLLEHLVCTPEGLPLNFEVFDGNRLDVTTVEDVVVKMEERFGQANRVWVMDRGMVSEKNIDFLRSRGASYIVGTPKNQLRHFERELADNDNWTEVQDGLEARFVDHPDGQGSEQYILCRSSARAAKERAMLARQMDRLCEELGKINTTLRRRKNKAGIDLEKINRRIGKWLGRYPAAARLLKADLVYNAAGHPTGLNFYCPITGHNAQRDMAKGAYLLRTNCTEEADPAKIWRWYVQLSQAEAAFRTAKSDIGLRPVYHQKAHRVEAHLLICFLSLAMWRTLEGWMSSKGLGTSARQLLKAIDTIRSMDIVVPVKRGTGPNEQIIDLRLRTVAKPDEDVATLLAHLGLSLPKGSKILQNTAAANTQNVVEKIH